jgi:hypothetical protein
MLRRLESSLSNHLPKWGRNAPEEMHQADDDNALAIHADLGKHTTGCSCAQGANGSTSWPMQILERSLRFVGTQLRWKPLLPPAFNLIDTIQWGVLF